MDNEPPTPDVLQEPEADLEDGVSALDVAGHTPTGPTGRSDRER